MDRDRYRHTCYTKTDMHTNRKMRLLLLSLSSSSLLLSILAVVSVGQQRKAPVVSRHKVDSDYSFCSKGMLLVCSNGNSLLLLFVTCWRFRILLVVVVALFLLWVYRGYSIPTNSINTQRSFQRSFLVDSNSRKLVS